MEDPSEQEHEHVPSDVYNSEPNHKQYPQLKESPDFQLQTAPQPEQYSLEQFQSSTGPTTINLSNNQI